MGHFCNIDIIFVIADFSKKVLFGDVSATTTDDGKLK